MKKIILLLILMIIPVAYACVDSDAVGLSFYNQGSVDYEGETYVDSCSGSELTEYKCEDGVMAMDKLTCDYGCVDGACLESSEIACGDLKRGEFIKDQTDYCYNENQMKNYYCTGNQATYQIVDCQFGCDEGRCLSERKKPSNCEGFNYKNSCGDLVVDDCLHCGFDCGIDYECVEILDIPCGTGSTGVCIKLTDNTIWFKKFGKDITTSVDGSLDFSGNRIKVRGTDLQTYPDKIYAKITDAGYTVQNIELRADDMVYFVDAIKGVKFLGLFSIPLIAEIEVSSLPDSELEVDKPWWGFLAW